MPSSGNQEEQDEQLRLTEMFAYLGTPEAIRWVAGFWFAIVFVEALPRSPIPLGGLAAFLLQFVLWFVLYRVASETLLDAAADTPGLSRSTFESGDRLAFGHVGLWIVFTLIVTAATIWLGLLGTVAAAVAALLVLPAATILLTLSRKFLTALWPPFWMRLIHRLGIRDYGLLCGVLAGLGVVYALVATVANAYQPGGWLAPIAQFTLWSAGVLGWFHLAGRAVAVHRHDLNLVEPDVEPERPKETFTRDPEQLWEEIRSRGGSRAMHAELARQLARQPDPAAVRETRIQHGRMHIEALLHAFEAPDEAVDRAVALFEADPGFALSDATSSEMLIDAAAEQGLRDAAVRLAENHLAIHTQPPRAHRVRLTLCELLADDDSARRGMAETWFRELMVADLATPEAERLRALKDRY